ncbi:MAG: hypothetical protein BMS9Abin05_2218 [Rhodothermia bacterium]|nr:MAG: hypothetical protein BMS9Abin05_2218 [Rhodothermia bacterium]
MNPSFFRATSVIGALTLLLWPASLLAQQISTCPRSQGEAYLEANNVRARILNTGGLFYRGEPHVYEIPRGSGKHSLFAGSLWIAGQVGGNLRVAAASYSNNEFWAGPLDDGANPPVDCRTYDRVYSVYKTDIIDYETRGIATEDLRFWPTGLGAPTLDAESNLIDLSGQSFSLRAERLINLSAGERPALRGNQSVWWVMNDRGNYHNTTDSEPLGIEVHGLAFAAINPFSAIDNATLFQYRVLNKNAYPIREAYVGVFLDVDLGNFDDDYIGSDSVRGMGYVYNADDDDDGGLGYGRAPPALGILFLEGPIADIDLKDNDRDGLVDEPNERLRTTTFGSYPTPGIYHEPPLGIGYYDFMRGRWRDGSRFTVGGNGTDDSNPATNFVYSGDPVTGAFWSELNIDGRGTSSDPGDRRLVISSGPFSIEPGEEADFTFAIVWARGSDNLDSVTELRKAADLVRSAFEKGGWDSSRLYPPVVTQPGPSPAAALGYNFPEPFSDRTTIRYRVPNYANVRLAIFDALGREVQTLVNEPKEKGEYAIRFDGANLPSGVYFYKIDMGRATAMRSMLLIK